MVQFKSAEEIQRRVEEMGQELGKVFQNKNPVVIGILNGAFIFTADLVRSMDCPLEIAFWGISSYGSSTQSSGKISETIPLSMDVTGRHVIVVEDIVDTGQSIRFIREKLADTSPSSITVVCLVRSTHCLEAVDYSGFSCGPEFLFGYGLDIANQSRHLPGLYIFEE